MVTTDRFVIVEIGRKEYKMVFTTAAMMEVVGRYGGVGEMTDKMDARDAERFDDIFWLISLVVNQGTMMEYGPMPPDDDRLIDKAFLVGNTFPCDLKGLLNSAMEAIVKGMGIEHNAAEDDDEVDVTLEELNSKNAQGALVSYHQGA